MNADDTIRLAAIRERIDKATPGPWERAEPRGFHPPGEQLDHGWDHHPCNDIVTASKDACVVTSWGHDADAVIASDDDVDFIAESREDVPYLLDLCERLEKKLAAVESRVQVYERLKPVVGRRNKVIAAHLVIRELREALGDE